MGTTAPTVSGGSSASRSSSGFASSSGLDVHLPVAGEADRRAAGREHGVGHRLVVGRSTAVAPRRTVTVVPVASAICDASVRCQIMR